MQLQVSSKDGTVFVRLSGRVTLETSPRLREELLRLQSPDQTRLVVDLGEVERLDTSGVATLLEALLRARRSGGELYLAQVGEDLCEVLELARLDHVFPILSDPREALEEGEP